MAVSKAKLRKAVKEFCSALMYHFLRDEVGLVPSLDSFVRKVSYDSTVLDWFSADELFDEFLVYAGLDAGEVEETGLKFPLDFSQNIKEGSFKGLVLWLEDNVNKFCRDNDVIAFYLVRLVDGWVLVVGAGQDVRDLLELMAEKGYDVETYWRFRIGERYEEREDEKWQEWLNVLRNWGTKRVEVIQFSELVEVRVSLKDLLMKLEEGIPIDDLYRGARLYMRLQSGQQDRVEAGEWMKGKIRDIYFIPFWGTRELHVYGKVGSERTGERSQRIYSPRIVFEDVELSREFSEYTPVKLLDRKMGEEFYVGFISPQDEVRVWCNCEDFFYTFWEVLRNRRAVAGPFKPPRKIVKGVRIVKKPRNVAKVEGACKHLFAMFEALVDAGLITSAWRSGREIDLTRGWYV